VKAGENILAFAIAQKMFTLWCLRCLKSF